MTMNRRAFLRFMGLVAVTPIAVKFVPKSLRTPVVEKGLDVPSDVPVGLMHRTPEAFIIATDRGWIRCDGRSLTVDEYPKLANVLRFVYGGDRRTRFNLPDMRMRRGMNV